MQEYADQNDLSSDTIDQTTNPTQISELPDQELEQDEDDMALVTSNGNESPAVAFLTNTLTTLSDTQKSILNSQTANRELLGVLIQDNFNLKEENNRLRERILEIERTMAQNRREDEWRLEGMRQEMESKIQSAHQIATKALDEAHATETPEIKTIKNKPGCLGFLFGGGDTQIVTIPRRRNQDQRQQSGATPVGGHPPPAPSSQSGQPAAHPRPTTPPE